MGGESEGGVVKAEDRAKEVGREDETIGGVYAGRNVRLGDGRERRQRRCREVGCVTAKEARAMCGNMSRSSFDSAVARQGWEGKRGIVDKHRCKLWRREDIEAYAAERQSRSDNRQAYTAQAAMKNGVRGLVAWADSLTRWPTDEEIEAQICRGWNFKDIVAVLELRPHRDDPDGKKLKALERRRGNERADA